MKTKIRPENLPSTIVHSFSPHWSAVSNLESVHVAPFLFARDPKILSADVVLTSPQLISVKVDIMAEHKSFDCSIVYGFNSIEGYGQR